MTERQKRRIREVQPYLSEVYRTAAREFTDRPVGSMVALRLPAQYTVTFWLVPTAPLTQEVRVLKDADALRFRVPDRPRKGWTLPKWRHLLPASPSGTCTPPRSLLESSR
jgi:hypothetical protein